MEGGEAKVRLLTYASLYPNSVQTAHGLFVERRLLRLVAQPGIAATVIAPVPWVLPPIGWLRRYRKYREIDRIDWRDGVQVFHPRFLSIPGLGLYLAPLTMFIATLFQVRRVMRKEGLTVIDAQYFYPDGISAALIASILKKPLVITARGTDVNLLPSFRFARWLIRWAAGRADRIITVSDGLRTKLIELGVDPEKVFTLRNGVDTTEFVLKAPAEPRRRLNLHGDLVLLSVGNLIDSKGHHLVVEALVHLPGAFLVIVGDGDRREHLLRIAAEMGVSDRVRLTGTLNPDQLVDYYNAADVLVLASEREGMPNVILEALSCGLPVVAANCGGVAEIVDRPAFGILLEERSAAAIARGVRELLDHYPARIETCAAARKFEWGETIARQATLYLGLAERAGIT